MSYQKLFSPGQIGPVHVKNRLVMEPAITLLAEVNGEAGDRVTRYFEERAKGGVGPHHHQRQPYRGFGPVRNAVSFGSTEYLRKLVGFVDAIHRHGARVFAQMKAPNPPGATVNGLPLTPSAPPGRPMTVDEIKQSIKDMGFAASVARQAGFDGFELHLCHGHFAAQFFSRFYNKRTDEYGGSFENRMRFAEELTREVRAAIGPGMALVARISGDEFAAHFSEEHNTLTDGIQIAKYLEGLNLLDALDISNSNNYNQNANCEPFSYTPGWKKHVAQTIRTHVSLPVIATNTVKKPGLPNSCSKKASATLSASCAAFWPTRVSAKGRGRAGGRNHRMHRLHGLPRNGFAKQQAHLLLGQPARRVGGPLPPAQKRKTGRNRRRRGGGPCGTHSRRHPGRTRLPHRPLRKNRQTGRPAQRGQQGRL
jgi:2,4-dienoyl-CoA reductase-like NADH-dependent reductase (Old Yellow Enzyme family)